MADIDDKEPVDDLRTELSEAYDAIDDKDQGIEPSSERSERSERSDTSDNWQRDEYGRFARRSDTPVAPGVEGQGEVRGPQSSAPTQGVSQASPSPMGPPSSWSIQAKAEFDRLPPAAREAIAKREAEVSAGFQQYHERYRPLDQYVEIANRAGTTLPDAIQAWMNAEELLHRDFEQGMLSLCEHFQVDPRALAARWGGGGGSGYQQPQQPQQYQNGGGQMPPQVQQELYALKNELASWRREQEEAQFSGIKAEVDAFSAKPDHRYFANVRPLMAQLIKTGAANDLDDAYDKACWSHPEVRQQLINQQLEAKSQAAKGRASEARRAAGSLNPGSPLPGASSSGRGSSKATIRDQLLEDWDALSA